MCSIAPFFPTPPLVGRTVFNAVAVNYLYRDRVMVRVRVRRPDSASFYITGPSDDVIIASILIVIVVRFD